MTKDTSCIITHSKVWVVAGRSELVASHDKEDKSGNLIKVASKFGCIMDGDKLTYEPL